MSAVSEKVLTIDALLEEHRVIDPPAAFRAGALVKDDRVYEEADRDLEGFWAREAERLDWFRRWRRVCKWDPPWVKVFLGGRLNAAHNCLDRHVATHPDRVAYFWEGEPGDTRRLTYRELHHEVGRFPNALRRLGVRRGESPSFRWPCWRAPGSAPSIRWCSAASPRTRCGTGSTTPTRRS